MNKMLSIIEQIVTHHKRIIHIEFPKFLYLNCGSEHYIVGLVSVPFLDVKPV